jgi:hypothetical protein
MKSPPQVIGTNRTPDYAQLGPKINEIVAARASMLLERNNRTLSWYPTRGSRTNP